MPNDPCDVVFVTMPFAMLEHPSLGLSLLKGALRTAGIRSTIQYLNLAFAEAVDFSTYGRICRTRETDLIGEWIFAAELFAGSQVRDAAFRQTYFHSLGEDFSSDLEAVRAQAGAFLDRAARRILALRPRVIGFTSVFQQQIASLALARRLKESDPGLRIIFGGANCESIMGAMVVQNFEFVDAAVSGQADLVIVELIATALAGLPVDSIQGVYTARNLAAHAGRPLQNAPAVLDMDALADPDFSDFFEQVGPLRSASLQPRLLFETARGCWWGEKHHCTFCGLNGGEMAFRSKSPARAVAELTRLVERYGIKDIGAVDNIMDMKYLSSVVPELARRNLGLQILYEVKSNLKKDQLRALKAAGITSLQPGIESLSTPVLKLMRKGVSAIQNVQLLKWCRELGISVSWNILCGFPGEEPEDYEAMARLIAHIPHLSPPAAQGKLRLDRFSPNFERAAEHGLLDVRPLPAYAMVYDLDESALAGLAYYFSFDYADARDVESYTQVLADAVAVWRTAHPASKLLTVDYEDCLLIADWRTQARRARVLQGLERALYLQCDRITGSRALLAIADAYGEPMGAQGLEARLQPLVDEGLLLREGDAYLALAVGLDEFVCDRELSSSLRAMAAMLLAA